LGDNKEEKRRLEGSRQREENSKTKISYTYYVLGLNIPFCAGGDPLFCEGVSCVSAFSQEPWMWGDALRLEKRSIFFVK
jgi:hypothetical protein